MRVRTQLKELVSFSKGAQINGDDLTEDGEYDYLNGGISPSGKWSQFNTPGGTVTISEGGNSCGFVNYMRRPFWCGAHCYYLFDPVIDTESLYYLLKSQQDRLMRIRTGACMPNIKKADLGSFELEYDTKIETQANVVFVLKRVEAIITERQQQLSALDDLIKARFVEMTEESDTVPTRMGDVATYINGYAFKPTDWEDSGLPIIRIQNLNDSKAIYNHYSGTIDRKYRVCSGDVLVSWATHLEAYIWRGGDAWLNQHIFRVIFDKMPINKVYFVYSTEAALKQAFRNAHGFKPTMEHIKRSDFENAVVNLPSLAIQEQFAAFVAQIDKSKSAIQDSLDETQILFESLMQQYFGS